MIRGDGRFEGPVQDKGREDRQFHGEGKERNLETSKKDQGCEEVKG